jgi:GTP-binding protein Era
MVVELTKTIQVPRVLCIGKMDARPRPYAGYWHDRAADYQAVVQVSGLDGGGVLELLGAILNLLPFGEPMYPPGETTNSNRTYQIGELIREQVYIQMDEEVPYRTKVVVDKVEDVPASGPDKPASLLVNATIYAPTDKLQRMLIGVGAKRVKQMRQFARREMKKQFGMPVDLDLEIRVDAKAGVPEES